MRYTIIHHDVRDQFNLTVNEYLMCDSYHQLSHQYPTTKTPEEIGKFNGVGRSSAFQSRQVLVEKGLLEQCGDGWKTTQLWYDAVTFQSRNDVSVQKLDSQSKNWTNTQYIIKEDITSEATASQVCDEEDDDVSIEMEDQPYRPLQRKRDTSYRAVFTAYGEYPLAWNTNRQQIQAAKNLIAERGIEQVKRAVKWWRKYKDEPFCPDLSTPWDMDNKWDKALNFKYKK